jgi:hypothetical protein
VRRTPCAVLKLKVYVPLLGLSGNRFPTKSRITFKFQTKIWTTTFDHIYAKKYLSRQATVGEECEKPGTPYQVTSKPSQPLYTYTWRDLKRQCHEIFKICFYSKHFSLGHLFTLKNNLQTAANSQRYLLFNIAKDTAGSIKKKKHFKVLFFLRNTQAKSKQKVTLLTKAFITKA